MQGADTCALPCKIIWPGPGTDKALRVNRNRSAYKETMEALPYSNKMSLAYS